MTAIRWMFASGLVLAAVVVGCGRQPVPRAIDVKADPRITEIDVDNADTAKIDLEDPNDMKKKKDKGKKTTAK